MLQHFRLIPFVLGLVLGIIGIYWVKPEREVVVKYPTPEKAGSTIYKDKNGVCYKYETRKVDCDANAGRMKNFPLEG